MKYYNYNRILNEDTKYNLVIAPRTSGKTVGAIKFLIKRYLRTEKLQYIDSTFDFLRQSDYIEKIIGLNKSDIDNCLYIDKYFPFPEDLEGFKIVCNKENYTVDYINHEN